MERFIAFRLAIIAFIGMFLSACAESQLLIHTAKKIKQEEILEARGHYKIGNPYQIEGIWYYPHVDYEYEETGIASWYGPNFHGKETANGEIFDMNDLSAAHRTLPLPSMVEVTNLENGRQINLRVNDRGPFAKGRIIDISRQGAQLLGFHINGTAKVRVRILAPESRLLAAKIKGDAILAKSGSPITVEKLPKADVDSEILAPPPGATIAEGSEILKNSATVEISTTVPTSSLDMPTSGEVIQVPIKDTNIYVQAGAFSQFNNANRARATLSPIGDVKITQVLVNGVDLFRVRLGPVVDVAEADLLMDQIVGAGYTDARIVIGGM